MKQSILLGIILITTYACSFGQGRNPNNNPAIQKVNMALFAIENLYVDTVDQNKLAEDAIIGMLEKLDPHSAYSNPEEVKELNEPLQGNFDGIGVQFNMVTDTLYIVQVIPGGPSEKIGIMAGDRILYVEDTLIAGVKKKNTDIMKMLRGPKGTVVNIKIMRNRNPNLLDFRIVRDKIPIHSLDAAYMLDKKTGYIKLNRFAATTYDEYKEALKKLKDQGMQNLILDLQGNGGGYLGAAIEIANDFLKQGSLIVYTEGTHQKRDDAKATYKGSMTKGRLAVLVDESSASASEIVAGAIQDWDRGIIVGRRTFGKGLVQRPIPLPDGSMIRLTTARYYTPSGRSIQKPYESGDIESYHKDLIDRYNHGEMLSADSIHFPDSLKAQTLVNKRTVYGGGGIMPDYFVPMDTTRMTKIHRSINATGTANKFVMNYVEDNRKAITGKYSNFDQFKANFKVTDQMMKDLLELYKIELKDLESNNSDDSEETEMVKEYLNEIKEETSSKEKEGNSNTEIIKESPYEVTQKDLEDYVKSRPLLEVQIKANIASNIYEQSSFYEIINEINDALKKALEIINDSNEYEKLLK